jgi:hypothetical protein
LGPLRASTFRATSRGPAATVGGRAVLPAMAARSIHGSRRSAGLGWFQSSTVNPSWVDRTRIWEWTKTGTKTGGAPRRASIACSWRSQQPVLTITVRLPSARASSDIAGAWVWVWPDTNTAISRREGVPAIGGGRSSARSWRMATSSRYRAGPDACPGRSGARPEAARAAVRRLIRNPRERDHQQAHHVDQLEQQGPQRQRPPEGRHDRRQPLIREVGNHQGGEQPAEHLAEELVEDPAPTHRGIAARGKT